MSTTRRIITKATDKATTIALCVAICGGGTAAAAVAITASSSVIHACEARSGALSIAPRTNRCPNGSKLIVWNQTGPRGATGPQGPTGPTGSTGTGGTTSLSIGSVNSGSQASASISNGKLNLTLPQGATGATGTQGPTGPQGNQGPTGNTGPTGPPAYTYKGTWSNTTTYYGVSTGHSTPDAVTYQGSLYVANYPTITAGDSPTENPSEWTQAVAAGAAGANGEANGWGTFDPLAGSCAYGTTCPAAIVSTGGVNPSDTSFSRTNLGTVGSPTPGIYTVVLACSATQQAAGVTSIPPTVEATPETFGSAVTQPSGYSAFMANATIDSRSRTDVGVQVDMTGLQTSTGKWVQVDAPFSLTLNC